MPTNIGKIVLPVKELIHEIGLAYTSSPKDDDQLRTVGVAASLQFLHLFLSTYNVPVLHIAIKFEAKVLQTIQKYA